MQSGGVIGTQAPAGAAVEGGAQGVAQAGEAVEAAGGGAAIADKHATGDGAKPPVGGGFSDPGPSASEQAFGDAGAGAGAGGGPARLDKARAARARRYNLAHPEHVAAFAAATKTPLDPDRTIDPEVVARWQASHGGLDVDGAIGPATVGAARAPARSQDAGDAHAAVASEAGGGGGGGSAGGGGGGGGGGEASTGHGKHPPPETYQGQPFLSTDPTIKAKQIALRLRQYDEDATHKGYVDPHVVTVPLTARYNEITRQAPSLPREFRMLMVGQSRGEQDEQTLNFNFAGVEGLSDPPPSDGRIWTRGLRSITISKAEYDRAPEKYFNWAGGGKGSIEHQIAANPHGLIYCMTYGPRPAYTSLASAVTTFVHEITRRLQSFQEAGSPVAAAALGGELDAYIKMVHEKTPSGIGAYNGLPEYPSQVRNGVRIARADAKLQALP